MGAKSSKPQRLNMWNGPAGRYDLYWSHRRTTLWLTVGAGILYAYSHENAPNLVDYYKENTEFEKKQLEYQKIKLQEKYDYEKNMSIVDFREKKLREEFDDKDKPRPFTSLDTMKTSSKELYKQKLLRLGYARDKATEMAEIYQRGMELTAEDSAGKGFKKQ